MNVLIRCISTLTLMLGLMPVVLAQTQITLEQAVLLAQENDPWLQGSRYREQASNARSVAAGTLPDPTISLGFANLPIDDFDFGREAMSQFKVGVSQSFPRGDTRHLQQQRLSELSKQHPFMRQNRRAQIAVSVAQLWLEVYRYRQSIDLIKQDRALFEHLVDVAQSRYTSASGTTSQQDLVRAQLELTRLEDRLTVLQQQQEMTQSKLNEWLPAAIKSGYVPGKNLPITLLMALPDNQTPEDITQVLPYLLSHPMIKAFDQQLLASETDVQLARQKYKPQWGLNASYGYRDDDPLGRERSDFFSVGISFDLPLFTSSRQDKEVQAAVKTSEALKTDKVLTLRSMRARFETASARLQRLNQREALYKKRLLQEIHDQAEASLTAYTNDVGDFAEVVRARISELNVNIDYLNITIDRLQAITELNYFLNPNGNNSPEDHFGGSSHE